MRVLRSNAIAVIIVASLVVGIGIARVAGVWNTESTRVPIVFSSGEFAGRSNPADIRGSYALSDIEAAFDVPVEVLAQAFGVRNVPDVDAFRANELEEMYSVQPDGGEVGTDAVRLFTALYTGMPYTAETTTRLPFPAVAVLESRLAPADLDAVRLIAVPLAELRAEGAEAGDGVATAPEPAEVEHVEQVGIVKGNTTFNDLLDWGLTKDQIEEVLGTPMGTRATTIRDFVVQNGGEFSAYRAAFQELLD